jgi:CubicO group peptidase (beta-lactamase class C family)
VYADGGGLIGKRAQAPAVRPSLSALIASTFLPVSDLQAALAPLFEENFTLRGELGAGVSVWREGREIVNLAGGLWDRQQKMAWDAGKEKVTFADTLAHRAGLPALDDPPNVFDYAGVIRRLEKQAPLWPPGDGHGYHPRTCGYLWDEIVRRVAGLPLGIYWRRSIAEPLGLDFWMGVPMERLKDVAPLHASRKPPEEDAFLKAFSEPDSITNRAFCCPNGLFSVSSMNTAAARMASFPAFGGIGSARAIGKFYGMLACGGTQDGLAVMAPEAVAAMSTRLTNGFDRVLRMETAFSAGLMQDPVTAEGRKSRFTFGPSLQAFGQPGAGGSFAFADPDRGIGFAYVMNQMEPGVLPNAKSALLVQRMYEALE